MEQGRKEIVERMTRTTIIIVAMINLISINTCIGAPSTYDPRLEIRRSIQRDNSLATIISEPCSTTNPCWKFLSPVPNNNDEIIREESASARLETEQKMNGEINSPADPWKPDSRIFTPRARSSSSIVRQLSPRRVKKDVFLSRSWGPGGFPFSVLYMKPPGARPNNNHRSSTGRSEFASAKVTPVPNVRRNFDGLPSSTTSPTKYPNNRMAARNGSTGQPRRHYSIIPQLFISHGWGLHSK